MLGDRLLSGEGTHVKTLGITAGCVVTLYVLERAETTTPARTAMAPVRGSVAAVASDEENRNEDVEEEVAERDLTFPEQYSEEEVVVAAPRCANRCWRDEDVCLQVIRRYTCPHVQCYKSNLLVGHCLECGCGELIPTEEQRAI